MGKIGTLTLKGASGTSYHFDVYSRDTNWRDDVNCVYYVSQIDRDRYHTEIYVGQTENLKKRFSNHHKQTCFDLHDYNAISVHRENNEESRLQKEEDLIEALNPPCND